MSDFIFGVQPTPPSKNDEQQMHTRLNIHIHDLLAEYTVVHKFRNTGSRAIEAIYTFPTPLDAAFIGMKARLGNAVREAVVIPAAKAQQRYDDAISEGDSAVLLEQLEPGLLCVNLGNLLPNEEGEITLRFVAAIPVAQAEARFSLPLVHRPRYGRYRTPEYATPSYSLTAENPLEAEITVTGLLLQAEVLCALHGASFQRSSDALTLKLSNAMLDRDLVLVFTLPDHPQSQALIMPDGDKALAYVPLIVPETGEKTLPVRLCLVMDCSGSMSGDAIRQSREALRAIASRLTENDSVQVLRFGSSTVELFRRPLKATSRVRNAMHELSATVNADLGGTNMDDALQIAVHQLGNNPEENRVIILVTDGAVQPSDIQFAQQAAQKHGIRIFVVAVGSSAGVDALQPLAQACKGTLERATPAEPIDKVVLRHFARARQLSTVSVTVDWGEGADALPAPAAYPGDSLILLAWLPAWEARDISVSFDGQPARTISLQPSPTRDALPSWAGKVRYENATGNSKQDIALQYCLLTKETSAILVHERDADSKPNKLPEMVCIASMLPAGMGHARKAIASRSPVRSVNYSSRHESESAEVRYSRQPHFLKEDVSYFEKMSNSIFEKANKLLLVLTRGELNTIKTAIFNALKYLIIDKAVSAIDKTKLLKEVPIDIRSNVEIYLEYEGHDWDDLHAAVSLLNSLLQEGHGELDDEEEAMLSLRLVR